MMITSAFECFLTMFQTELLTLHLFLISATGKKDWSQPWYLFSSHIIHLSFNTSCWSYNQIFPFFNPTQSTVSSFTMQSWIPFWSIFCLYTLFGHTSIHCIILLKKFFLHRFLSNYTVCALKMAYISYCFANMLRGQ